MQLTALIKPETVLMSLDVQSKEECIQTMAETLAKAGFVTEPDTYVEAVVNREKTGSTGVGFGVAIPHGKSKGVAQPGVAFAKLAKPVDWKSLDGNPVSVVFLIAVPEENVGNEHLQILVAISRKLIHEDFRNELFEATSVEDVFRILETL
ncbi:PTS sugar transporter subunit IIA [Effusibacillus consociatus]|uniref:PTS sugar transporter subunit IIA n=1 Tax=Effusibacillus consociatus TaxID=1117041 RepID=A0ABV9Q0D8_9BACL